ncbi:MAG: DUF3168 domain-containing protein [Acidimicrobiia bacterium]|nr:DUF3168 domain-containing protein [Acidimicrobiia bacterium]
MSSLYRILWKTLQEDDAVTGIVGDRIYPLRAPSSAALPRITYERTVSGHEHHMEGSSGLTNPRFTVDCWASSSADAEDLADAVRLALDATIGQTIFGVDVRSIFVESIEDDVFFRGDGSQKADYLSSVDFSIWYRETKPS